MKKVSVECRDIGLSYGVTEVLRGVNLSVQPGEFFALLGPSGSGKSSLLRLIAGFNRLTRGELHVDGRDITALETWQRPVGLVFQNYALWPHLNVWDNVAFGLVERRVQKSHMRQRVGAALEMVGLSAYGQRRPSQLSGGQQQRVALARTLVVEPQVLLLDEPLSNLDKTLRVQMRQELLALQRRLGLTTLFVTHDQEEAMTTADRMAVLDQGVVQQVGTPQQLYDQPANAFVAHFVGTMNALPVDHQGAPAWLCLRPHHVVLRDGPQAQDLEHAWLEGVVEDREFLGACTRYRVRLDGLAGWQVAAARGIAPAAGALAGNPFRVQVDEPHAAGRHQRDPGQRVRVGLALSEARLLPR